MLPIHAQQPPKPEAKPELDPAHAEKMQAGLELFKSQVRAILIKNCIDCHGGDEVQSGLDLATRKALLRGGAHGPAIVPGKARDSNVVRFISHKEKPFMPEGNAKLPSEQIDAISRWIDLGAALRSAARRKSPRSRFVGEHRRTRQSPRLLGFPPAGQDHAARREKRKLGAQSDRPIRTREAGRKRDPAKPSRRSTHFSAESVFRFNRPATGDRRRGSL